MTRTTKYVALDVHSATTVASVRSEQGRVIARTVLPTEASALTQFLHSLRGSGHLALEEGIQAQWLYDLLAPLVQQVIVCDRRGERHTANKGDFHDADDLSEQLRRGARRPVYHGNAARTMLKELTRAYQNLVEDSTHVDTCQGSLPRPRDSRTGPAGVSPCGSGRVARAAQRPWRAEPCGQDCFIPRDAALFRHRRTGIVQCIRREVALVEIRSKPLNRKLLLGARQGHALGPDLRLDLNTKLRCA